MDQDALYDRYLDLVMGEASPPTPEAFLGSQGVESAPEELLQTLHRLHESRQAPVARADRGRGRLLGDFRLIERISEGGMGVVWAAEQVSLKRRVAVKILRPEAAESLTANARFDREARAIAKLRHPGIARIYAVGEAEGPEGRRERYIAMELVDGRGLDEIIEDARRGGPPIPPTRAARWGAGLARALQSAHEAGIVHRDVKPSNIRIAPDGRGGEGRAVLLDFGLARDVSGASAGSRTLTEAYVGTPAYSAPEQVGRGGGVVDGRTDVYSLGAVLYEVLCGRRVVEGDSLEQTLVAILTTDPEPLITAAPGAPADLSVVIMKAIEKDPEQRYRSAAAMAEDLEAVLELRPITARPPGRAERVRRWALRNRGLAAALATVAGAAAVGAAVLTVQRVSAVRERGAEIRRLLGESEAATRKYAADRSVVADVEAAFEALRRERLAQYMSPEQDHQFDEAESRVDRARKERELAFIAGLELADRAGRLGAAPEDVRRAKGAMYLQRYIEADRNGDVEGRALYHELVLAHDGGGELQREMQGTTSLHVRATPENAEVHLFRRAPASELSSLGEPRNVLRPIAAPEGWTPPGGLNAWGLDVAVDAGELRAGDVILTVGGEPVRDRVFVLDDSGSLRRGDRLVSVGGAPMSAMWDVERIPESGAPRSFEFSRRGAPFTVAAASLAGLGAAIGDAEALAERGGVEAVVWVEGVRKSTTLPTGLVCRTTAAPALLGELSALPTPGTPLSAGSYILVARAPGMRPAVIAVDLVRNQAKDVVVRLAPERDGPPAWSTSGGRWAPVRSPDGGEFWLMEREVTVREYFEFLNEPGVLERAAADARLAPMDFESARGQRDAAGRFQIPSGWREDWPILFVTWHGAKAYAEHLGARPGGEGWIFDLPSEEEWVWASACASGEFYVWGARFRPKWTVSCFGRPTPQPEPCRSRPIDRSVLGVYDLAGSMSEWTRRVWVPGQSYYKYAGGAWGTGDPAMFQNYGGNGALPETRGGMIGFRVAARRREAP